MTTKTRDRLVLTALIVGTVGPGLGGVYANWPILQAVVTTLGLLGSAIWVNREAIWPKKADEQKPTP